MLPAEHSALLSARNWTPQVVFSLIMLVAVSACQNLPLLGNSGADALVAGPEAVMTVTAVDQAGGSIPNAASLQRQIDRSVRQTVATSIAGGMAVQEKALSSTVQEQGEMLSSALGEQEQRINELSEGFKQLEQDVRELKQLESFSEPPVIESVGGILRARMVAKMGPTLISGRTVTGAFTYEGIFPGPTLKVRPGDRIQLTFQSEITSVTNVYFHGLHVSPGGNSNNIFVEVDPDDAVEYFVQIPIDHPTGLYWYHPLTYGDTDKQVYNGLSGLLLVEGGHDSLPGVQGVKQRIMALKSIQLDQNYSVVPVENVVSEKQIYTVNGQLNPTLLIQPGETQLWRIANIGNGQWYDLTLEGHQMLVVAWDGVTVAETTPMDSLVLPPGGRVEFLVRGSSSGIYEFKTNGYDNGVTTFPQRSLATLVSQGDSVRSDALPGKLSRQIDLAKVDVDNQREIRLSRESTRFLIDGKEFDLSRVDQLVRLDDLEEWTIHNETIEELPFHVHVNDVQVTRVNGVPKERRVSQDVVRVPANGSATIRIRFSDFLGKLVFHSQDFRHLDRGMMGVVEMVQLEPQQRGESVR